MAMEWHVFFRGELPTTAALVQAMAELGFPLSIPDTSQALDKRGGFMPMLLRGQESGVEFDVFEGRDEIEAIALDVDIDPRFDRTGSFRWAGDENEMLCAMCAAGALARLTNGIAFGACDERPLTPEEAIAMARQHLELVAMKG